MKFSSNFGRDFDLTDQLKGRKQEILLVDIRIQITVSSTCCSVFTYFIQKILKMEIHIQVLYRLIIFFVIAGRTYLETVRYLQ